MACTKSVLNKADQNGVDVAVVWSNQSTVNEYLNALYDLAMPNWPTPGSIHNTSDELNNATVSILNGTLTGTANEIPDIYAANKEAQMVSGGGSGDIYYLIYRCNNAIQNLGPDSPLGTAVTTPLKGQFYFFRAYIYFLMVRIYGGVPLILTTQDPANGIPSLYTPRAKSSTCFAQIASDLDSATAMLPATWPASTDGGRITRAVASAFKGKALLYWASPQFNPTNIASRWTDAYNACKAAYTLAQSDGYALYPATSGGLGNVWIDESSNNKERMMWRTLDAVSVNPTHGTNNENITRPYSETSGGSGSNQPTWNLVKAFPMANGLSPYLADGVTVNPASGYDPVQYWLNRDPRFNQTIAYNGQIWNLSGKSNRHEWVYQNISTVGSSFLDDASKPCITGFYCRKICNPTITPTQALYSTNTGGGSGMDWIELRFAEVLLNYAECANATGDFGTCQSLLIALRQARGFSQGSYNYGLANVTQGASMAAFILTEREIEFAMEGKRYWDLRRTRQYDKLTGTSVQALVTTVNYNATTFPYIAGAANSKYPSPPAIYMDIANASGGRICDTLNVNNKATYTKFFTATPTSLTYSGGTGIINYPTNYYFYPLPVNFLQTSPALQQTAGWPGGSFDPLQ